MNNDKLEVNTHEEQGTQDKVALKNWPKTTHNFSLLVSIAYSFQISSFSRVIRPSN